MLLKHFSYKRLFEHNPHLSSVDYDRIFLHNPKNKSDFKLRKEYCDLGDAFLNAYLANAFILKMKLSHELYLELFEEIKFKVQSFIYHNLVNSTINKITQEQQDHTAKIIGYCYLKISAEFVNDLLQDIPVKNVIPDRIPLKMALRVLGVDPVTITTNNTGTTILQPTTGIKVTAKSLDEATLKYSMQQFNRDIQQTAAYFPKSYHVSNLPSSFDRLLKPFATKWQLTERQRSIIFIQSSANQINQYLEEQGKLLTTFLIIYNKLQKSFESNSITNDDFIKQLAKQLHFPKVVSLGTDEQPITYRMLAVILSSNQPNFKAQIIKLFSNAFNAVISERSKQACPMQYSTALILAKLKTIPDCLKTTSSTDLLQQSENNSALFKDYFNNLIAHYYKVTRTGKRYTSIEPIMLNHQSLLNNLRNLGVIYKLDIISEEVSGRGLFGIRLLIDKAITTDDAEINITANNFRHDHSTKRMDGDLAKQLLNLNRDGAKIYELPNYRLNGNLIRISFEDCIFAFFGSSRLIQSDYQSNLNLDQVSIYPNTKKFVDPWIDQLVPFQSELSYDTLLKIAPPNVSKDFERSANKQMIFSNFKYEIAHTKDIDTQKRLTEWLHYKPSRIVQKLEIVNQPYFALEYQNRGIVVLDSFARANAYYVFYNRSLDQVIYQTRKMQTKSEVFNYSNMRVRGYHNSQEPIRRRIQRVFDHEV